MTHNSILARGAASSLVTAPTMDPSVSPASSPAYSIALDKKK